MKIFLSLVCLTIGGIVVEAVGVRLKRASGGKLVSIEDVPYVVSLRRRVHVCSGAFISTQHVLTAAHCVLDKSFRRLYTTRVISGTDKPDRTDVGHEIGEIIPHDDFLKGKSSCDIAVVKLVHFVWNAMQNQMELPNAGPRGIVFATFTGFQLRSSQRSVTGLQELNVKTRPIIPTSNNTYDSDQIFYGTFGYAQRINNLDGQRVAVQNAADNIGLKLAYHAYLHWAGQNREEQALPGLSYTPKQMFWISMANTWCRKEEKPRLRISGTLLPDTPAKQRVNGAFANRQEFADDFKCKPGTKMNPVQKCSIF